MSPGCAKPTGPERPLSREVGRILCSTVGVGNISALQLPHPAAQSCFPPPPSLIFCSSVDRIVSPAQLSPVLRRTGAHHPTISGNLLRVGDERLLLIWIC